MPPTEKSVSECLLDTISDVISEESFSSSESYSLSSAEDELADKLSNDVSPLLKTTLE